ncbi:hypothetical protein [Parasporobacterium paucivorans]|uniref:Uncharacterized protein n=1 Tax=Parasporobacterium paucivorans DSM 15970 TaxID=1122934 RepID=A0A1M6IVU1_9FIRM|nr:hypothetical protein [Parasporobacterium paucivorans]SHJ38504.1 hypothetical protein SAMN02745691_01867 [Parasporobacterium paucivorans DSM 15970]
MENTLKNYIIVGASNEEEAVATDKIHEILDGLGNESFKEVFFFSTAEEIEGYAEREPFIQAMVGISKATLKSIAKKKKEFNHLIINAVSGETDLFLWGIDIAIEGEELSYGFVDWANDGNSFKFDGSGSVNFLGTNN